MPPRTISHALSNPHLQPFWVSILENTALSVICWCVCGQYLYAARNREPFQTASHMTKTREPDLASGPSARRKAFVYRMMPDG